MSGWIGDPREPRGPIPECAAVCSDLDAEGMGDKVVGRIHRSSADTTNYRMHDTYGPA